MQTIKVHGITYKHVSAGNDGGGEDVSKRETLSDEEGVVLEVGLENSDGLEGLLLGSVDVLLVVGVTSDQGAEPGTEVGKNLSVGEGHPLQDGSVVLLGLSEKGGLLVLGGDYNR